MVEEEKKKQKEEEEIRMKQQWEEEKQEQIEKEKRRMRHISQNSRASENEKRGNSYNNRYNETRDSPSPPLQSYYEKQPSPTPPPQPRPANTRKVIPKKKQAPKMKPASPLPSGAHTALYDNADQIDGAYENVGRLKQCYNCGRSFAEDRLGKHEQACKNITKKRKVLDTEKLRTKGTDMEQFVAHRQATPPQVNTCTCISIVISNIIFVSCMTSGYRVISQTMILDESMDIYLITFGLLRNMNLRIL